MSTQSSNPAQRRSDPRFLRRINVEVATVNGNFGAKTRNLSLGGLFLETDQKLAVGLVVTLRFTVPTQSEMIEVRADVRWIERNAGAVVGLGFRFDGLRARDVWAINKFLESRGEEDRPAPAVDEDA